MKDSNAIDAGTAQTVAIEDSAAWLGGFGQAGATRRWRDWMRQIFSEAPARLWLASLLLLAMVFVIYLPLLPGSFVMDDARLVGEQANPLVNGELTLGSVWFQTDFPLTLCAWWAEWSLWGNQPLGYHAVNIALQAISAILLWRVLARLKIRGAWLGAALFAIHPVAVGSVARIAELKNTLSLPFFLLSFWAYLRYEQSALYGSREIAGDARGTSATGWYALSFVGFILALFSKTTVVALPVALLCCAAWQRGRVTRRDLAHTAPFFLVALAFGLMSIWFQKYQALAGEVVTPQSLLERFSIAGRNFWFYFGKAALPINLTIFYSRWRTDLSMIAALLPVAAMALLFVFCWRLRRGWGKHALLGIGVFAILLFPSLGFFDAQCFTKFQVSDHLQYLPMIALTSLAAAAIAAIPRQRFSFGAGIGVLLVLSVLSFKRSAVFSTEEGLLRDTLVKNPAAWPAHNDLGVVLVWQGKISAAAEEFRATLKWKPNDPDALANLAQCDALQGRPAVAVEEYRTAVRQKPDSARFHEGLASALSAKGDDAAAIGHFKIALRLTPKVSTRLALAGSLFQTRNFHGAVEQFRQVLSAEPDNVPALNNLAYVLGGCPDKSVQNADEAVKYAERACRLTAFKEPGMIQTLAAAYVGQGRMAEATAAANLASRLQMTAAAK